MNYITHSLGGVAAGFAVISATGISDPVQQTTVVTGAVLGSLFLDIDHRQSWIGHKAPIAAEVASGLFKHRGFLHTPVFILLIWILLSAGIPIWFGGSPQLHLAILFKQGFVPGMLSHLILDTLNIQGIMWLWPISKKRQHILPIRTGSLGEVAVCAVLSAVLLGQYNIFF
ncbi:metal-dependent hydrolase [Anaerovorax sp. IOR16]|uniref:metal-dependent hydrolase n=1 Tax=Anaerovorax sp. IOR16 TaxID=2773458 RepID=UPI0019D2AE8D|nr:metal-dependent hydrolase [Anaerovorax sp. IOR16]